MTAGVGSAYIEEILIAETMGYRLCHVVHPRPDQERRGLHAVISSA